MVVAICDDEQVFCDSLKSIVLDFKRKNHLHIDIYTFMDGESLLNSDKVFDVVFLDYQMPGINGMDVAREFRRRNCICSIVFITAHPHFVFDSFEVQPYRFFIKPIDAERIEALLNIFIANQKQLAPLVVINDEEQTVVQAKDILYLEGDGKYCTVRTLDNTFTSSKTLSQVHALLPQHCFYRSHKSYVVNLYSVSAFDQNTVTLTNGESARIGRSKVSEFKNTYKQFIKDYYIKI